MINILINALMEYSQISKSCRSYPARITKDDKEFAKKLDFKNIKFPVEIREFTNSKKKQFQTRKNIQFVYQKNVLKENMLTYY